MAGTEVIRFSQWEQEKADQLTDGDAREFVKLGVLNTASEDWQKLSSERQQEILDEIAARLEGSKDKIDALKSQIVPVSLGQTPRQSQSGYVGWPLKEQVNYQNDFEKIEDSMASEQMGSIVKRNINLMQTKVREQWVKHFDDALLGSSVGFVYPEWEHLGRVIQPRGKVTNIDNAGNILAFGQTSAAEQIDALVAQNTPESKAILKAMNESVQEENGALFLWIGLYLATKTVWPVLTATLKWIIKFMSIKGKWWVQLVALGAELYEQLDRKMKWADPANKTLWDSVKDRIKGETLAGKKTSELAENEKKMKTEQVEGVREVVRDALYEKYGKGLTRAEFETQMNASTRSTKDMVSAKNAEKDIMWKMEKHLPIDLSPEANDRYELDEKFRKMALDMEVSTWKKIRTGLFRFFFEKWGLTNLVFQNGIVDLSNRVWIGTATKNALAEKLDTVKIDIGDGKELSIPRVDETRFKELMKNIDADMALAAQKAEMDALVEVRRLETEINTLRADGIPDNEQWVDEKIRQLEEAKIRYNEYKGLHDAAQSARAERDTATSTVKEKEWELETAQENLAEAKKKIQSYNDYYRVKWEYDTMVNDTTKAETQLKAGKQRVADAIRSLEWKVQGKITFTSFTGVTSDADFLQQARSHIESLQSEIATYNSNAMEKIDTGDGAIKVIQSSEGYSDILSEKSSNESKKEVELDWKIGELTTAGIWDTGTKSVSKTLSELQQEEKTAQQEEKTAQKNLTEAQEKQKKVQAGTDKAKKAVAAHPAQSSTYKGTQRQADGTVTSRDIKSQAEIDAELKKAKDMRDKLDAKKKAEEARAKAEAARATVAQKVWYTAETKPKVDGTHSTESQTFFNKMTQQQTDTMTTQTEYINRAAAKWLIAEIKDGKATLTDAAGKKFEYNLSDEIKKGEFLKKLK